MQFEDKGGSDLQYIPAKTIVTRTKSSAWFGARYNMNLYRGCPHGCIYCDSRSDCYRITDFDQVRAKANALQIVRDDLRRKVLPGVIATGAMSDPYNPAEQELLLTRHALELVSAYGFGVAIATKSTLITRDIDILQEIKSNAPVLAKITITTPDDDLAGKIEPRAPSSSARFACVKQLSEAGIFTGILLMPILPFLADKRESILELVKRAGESGARFIYPMFGVTLRPGQREYFYRQLERAFPGAGLAAKYQRRYGSRYQCLVPKVKSLWADFAKACDQLGLLYRMTDIIRAYQHGYTKEQLSLFE